MGNKRKRESSTVDSPKSIPTSIESRPSLDLNSKSTKSDHANSKSDGGDDGGQKGPKVQYIAAEGSNSWSKSLDLERDYAKSIKHIGKKLGVPKEHAHKLKLSHVRDGGREVEILDNFDYEAFKARAIASPGSQLTLKVYGVSAASVRTSTGGTPVSENGKKAQDAKGQAKADVKEVAVEKEDTKKPSMASQSPAQSNGQPSSSKSKSKPKQSKPPNSSTIPPQVGSAPSPNSPTAKSTNDSSSKKAEQKRKRNASSEIPSTPSPASSAPSPFGARPSAVLNFHDRYKPARSSPLNPNRGKPPSVAAASPSTPLATGTKENKRKERNRRRKQKRAEHADGESDSSTPNTPQSAPNTDERASELPSGGEKAGSVDNSPPRKRSRKSLSKKLQASNESTPKSDFTPSTPEPTTAKIAEVSIPPSAEQSTDTTDAKEIPGPSTNTPSIKKVVRVSNEEYDLKQKPKESEAVSSSITGAKKKQAKKTIASPVAASPVAEKAPVQSTAVADSSDALPKSSVVPLSITEPVSGSPVASSATESVQVSIPTADEPSTPASKRSKSKATPKGKAIPVTNDETPPSPAPISSSQETPQTSSSPPPSSGTPSTAATPSKKKKATRTKKSESSEPSMMQQILARQRERVAAEKAAKAALEAAEATAKAGPEANGEVTVASVVDSAAAAETRAAPSTERVPTKTEPTAPMPVVAEPETDEIPVIDEASAAGPSTSPVESPAIEKTSSDQSVAIDGPAPTLPTQAVTEAVPSSKDLLPSSLKSSTINELVSDSPAEAPADVEMREASPDVEPAAVDASTTASWPVEHQAPNGSAAPALESAHQENDTTPIAGSANDAEPELPDSQVESTLPEILVPETVIPPQNATSSGAKAKSTKSKRKIEVPCTICLRTPWHIQKDCPEVKAGPANLRYLLTARQDQHASISTEDEESHFDSSIEAIQEWIERLEMIASKVNGLKKDSFKARSPVRVMGNKEGLRLDLNAADPPKGKRKSAALPESDEMNDTTQAPETTAASATTTTTPPIPLDSAQVAESDSAAHSPPESRPESPMAVPDTYNFPPIHLRAMQKSRRPGSLSGLSVSDAIIETESSDDSSSDDEAEGETDGLDSDTSSVVSDSTDSDSDSDSDSDGSDSGSSRVVMPADPSDAMKFSLTRDLSEREKKKARLSAAKMQPVNFDLESVVDDGETDNLEASPSPTKAASRSMARTGSDSSIGDFGDGDSRRSSIDSAATAPYRSQAPPVIASSARPRSPSIASALESIEDPHEPTPEDNGPTDDDEINENTPSGVVPPEEAVEESEDEAEAPVEISSGQRSRSFREMDGTAASSPDLDDSAGLQAVQQGIDEEDDNVSVSANGDSQTVSSNPVATQSLSQARRTRSSASESVIPDESVIVPASQPLRRSSRTSISATPQDPPRRLRSVSRDFVERTPPPPARSTRSRSQSQVPMSPSTPKARRASRTLVSDVEAEDETPKQTSRRTRVTRSTQPEEPLPTVTVSQSTQSQSQSAVERQTQSTPVRRSTRASPSPLFMTQGSQVPATQFYNANPETIAIESSTQPSSQANGRKTRTRKAASPIPEEQEEDGDVNMSPRATSASLPPTQSDIEEHPTSGQADPADQDVEMESQASSSDDDNDNNADDEDDLNSIPDIQPPKPRILPPTSSQSTTPIYPSLSSLPKELLRKSWNMLSGNNPSTPVSARQALTNGHNGNHNGHGHSQMNGDDSDDSGSSSDSSVEAAQAPPSVLKGRFASGGMKKKPRSSQVSGW